MSEPRFDAQPLIDAIERRGLGSPQRALGVSGQRFAQHVRRGLSWGDADCYAIAIGLHPASIWGDAWFDAALEPGIAAIDSVRRYLVAAGAA